MWGLIISGKFLRNGYRMIPQTATTIRQNRNHITKYNLNIFIYLRESAWLILYSNIAKVENMEKIPLPPLKMMVDVNAQNNAEIFEVSRVRSAEQLKEDLLESGINISELSEILDYGCGCGRVIAGWEVIGHRFRLHGCDYNKELIDWCRWNISGIEFKQNYLGMPLPYNNGQFDLIYLFSVFTHLAYNEQISIIKEFRRILKPMGYIYLTFHGKYFEPIMLNSVPGSNNIFSEKGFLIHQAEKQGSNDCWVLHKEEKLQEMFHEFGFRVVKHFEGLLRGPTHISGWQDSIVFQLRPNTDHFGSK